MVTDMNQCIVAKIKAFSAHVLFEYTAHFIILCIYDYHYRTTEHNMYNDIISDFTALNTENKRQ